MIGLEVRGDVRVLHMSDGENRVNPGFVTAMHEALDTVEAAEGPCALVTTGSGKFYSNGLDLGWMASAPDAAAGFLDTVYSLLDRLLRIDVYTVAALNGHAFAAGAMLASVHDCVIMRADRGYWCLPEVDLGLPLTPEMHASLAAHVPRPALAQAALTGRRYTAHEAVAAGIATEAVPEDAVVPRAVEIAAGLSSKSRTVIAAHKELLYGKPSPGAHGPASGSTGRSASAAGPDSPSPGGTR
jgi:enoyl-CoA hydratase/carnithine racemase